MFDFQNVGIKIFVWTVANKNKYQKYYLDGLQEAYPLKTQNLQILHFLSASCRLNYEKIPKKLFGGL